MSTSSPVSSSLPPPPPKSTPSTPSSSLITQPPRSHPHANQPTSQVQLAAILHETLSENELLKRQLSVSKRNAEKYERMVTLIQSSPQSTSTQPSQDSMPPAAMKRIMDYETRLERAEIERDELQARIRVMQEIWAQLDQYLSQCEFRAKDAREGFNKILQDAGGPLHPMTKEQWHLNLPDIPYPNSNPFPSPTYLSSDRQPRSITSRPIHRQAPPPPPPPNSLQMAPTMLINSNGNPNPSLPSFSLPPHPSGSARIRPRAESLDGQNYSTGPPPTKKHRSEVVYRDDTQRYSRSPQNVVHSQPLSSSTQPGQVHHQHREEHPRRLRHQSDADSPAVRSRSPHRPRSRSSSTSLDDMILEATSNNHDAQHPQQQPNMFTYPQPQPHQRSTSPNAHSQSPVNSRGVMFSGQSQGGVLHSYQTHIFAPPVTGAPPVKKSNTATSLSGGISRGGSLAGNSQSGHHGAHVLGPGGYPPTNAQGQRICRQCGLVGRYKDGKCVEKWGPGPEGPGTVCDKCRKKMKRVERRGTIESQQQREQREQHQQVQQALAHHRSQQHIQPAPPSPVDPSERTPSSTSGSSVRRADTMVVGPGMNYDTQRMHSSRMEDTRLPPIAAAPSHSRSGDVSRREVHVVHVSAPSTNGNGVRRSIPTPPYIATLSGSNEHDSDDRELMRHEKKDFNLLNGSSVGASNGHSARHEQQPQQHDRDRTSRHTPDAQRSPGGGGGGSHMEVEDADGDAEGEEDAEADLLEAVDAAEEAHHLKDKSNSVGSRSSRGGDDDDVDEDEGDEGDGDDDVDVEMKIEEEI